MKTINIILLSFLLSGCMTSPYQTTIDQYSIQSTKVTLGMSKSQVVEILQPTQTLLKNSEIKRPDIYKKDGVLVEILYFRSGWQSDGLSTDDEYTPYLFNDGKLVAIGWATLGGPKSQGQAVSTTTVIVY